MKINLRSTRSTWASTQVSATIAFGRRGTWRQVVFRFERACWPRAIEVPKEKARALEFYRIWTTLPDGTSPARENLPAVLPAGSSLSISIRRRDRRFRRPIRVTVHIDVAATDGGDRPPRPKSRSELWRDSVAVATERSEIEHRGRSGGTDFGETGVVAATDGGDRPPRPKSRSELWRKQEVAGAATSGVVVATDGSELWLRKQRAATDG